MLFIVKFPLFVCVATRWHALRRYIAMMEFRSFFGLLACALVCAAHAQSPASIPVERFFQVAAASRPTLSPDGKSIAMLTRLKGRQNILIYEIETRKPTIVTSFEDFDVVSVHWVNDKRLVFSSGNVFEASGIGSANAGGLYALDRDGTGFRRLAQSALESARSGAIVYRRTGYAGAPKDPGDDILVFSTERSTDSYDLYRVNTRSGRRALITSQVPARVQGLRIDHNDLPRVVIASERTNTLIYYQGEDQSGWQKIHDADFRQPGIVPIAIDFDGKTVYAASNVGRDTAVLVQWDPQTKTVLRTIAEIPGQDVGEVVFDRVQRKIVGVRADNERGVTHWIDEGWKATQKSIDSALPNATNIFTPPAQGRRFLVRSASEKNPGTVFLFDGETRKLEYLFDALPEIKPEHMADTKLTTYRARDGLPIPALLTLPRGGSGKNLPLIVLVHGGPWVGHEDTTWSPEAQFLASRGYAVLRPQFRGTTGLGLKHFLSSFKQWGGTMQDDLSDGVQWAVKQGIADAKRVCLMGASYGGYAVLQGLAATPELYRCGVNIVGVTDLLFNQTITWADYSGSDFLKFHAPIMVGDPDADRAMLIARSPARNAEKIIAPVLMFYGVEDKRVPLEHGTRMFDAMRRVGKGSLIHMEVFADEGHGFGKLENRVKTYTMIEAFLKESLK
jgi:dipeptidyl aminopeptidase/acylaminoacyl peptidase